ncbi:MAG: hypothetical protein JWN22_539 [Nocardioides sp.]|nr:hypothetical protein [Nocardioides sp.]
MSKSVRPLVGLVAVSALLASGVLSGCGVAGTDFQPGVAARVGDSTVSSDKVEQLVAGYCSAIEDQLRTNKTIVPQSYLSSVIAGELAMVEAARQLADQYAVEAGKDYDQKVAQLEGAVTALKPDEQTAVVEVESAASYVSSVVQAVGTQQLAAAGTAKPTSDAATAAGQKALVAWLDDHDVRIDPKFGIAIKDGQAVPDDTSLSYAVGTTAKSGQATTPDQAYAGALPAAHRCG